MHGGIPKAPNRNALSRILEVGCSSTKDRILAILSGQAMVIIAHRISTTNCSKASSV